MKTMIHSARLAAACLAGSALMAACGGGGDAGPTAQARPQAPDPTTVPASALASPQAFVAYVASLPTADASANSSDPLVVTSTLPPVTDIDEPVAL